MKGRGKSWLEYDESFSTLIDPGSSPGCAAYQKSSPSATPCCAERIAPSPKKIQYEGKL